MIECIIIEDQEPAQRILKKYLADRNDITLVEVFRDALSALEFLKSKQVDLIFLDIHLPKLSGMDFMAVLSPKPQIVLTTAFSDYALESYEFDVTDYLLKPFSSERFEKAIDRVKKQFVIDQQNNQFYKEESDTAILVKEGYDFVKIAFKDILYVKSDGDYTHVFTQQQRHIVAHSLKYWLEQLPVNGFCQIHRSYVINIKQIQKVQANVLWINNVSLPIGRVYKKEFMAQYKG